MRYSPSRRRVATWHAPALLLLWQTAPVQVELDEVGKFRVALGWSAGKYEDQRFGCSGNVTERAKVSHQTVGAAAEFWPHEKFRVSAGLGMMTSSADSTWAARLEGGFGSVVLAREGEKIGFGAGVMVLPPGATRDWDRVGLTLYFRAGRRDALHFRIDGNETARPGAPPGIRLGVATGYGPAHRPRVFVGLGASPVPDNWNDPPGATAEVGIPLGRVMPVLGGSLRPNEGQTDWDLGLGVRIRLGR